MLSCVAHVTPYTLEGVVAYTLCASIKPQSLTYAKPVVLCIQVLDELEQKLSQLLRKLQSRYGDIVTYKVSKQPV
jgi:hypothetical protein